MKKKGAHLTTAALLIAGKTLVATFAHAAVAPDQSFLGVPYIEINEAELQTGDVNSKTPGSAFRKIIATRNALDNAAQQMGIEGESLNDNQYLASGGMFFQMGFRAVVPSPPSGSLADTFAKSSNPHGGIIIVPSEETLKTKLGHTKIGTGGDVFISSLEYDFFRFHEIAHVAGASEPAADQIAAIRFLQKHPDKRSYIEFLRDKRQIGTLNEAGRVHVLSHGQIMVDALDEVLAMPTDKVMAMSETDMRKIIQEGRFNLSDSQVEDYNAKSAVILQNNALPRLAAQCLKACAKTETRKDGSRMVTYDFSDPAFHDLAGAIKKLRADTRGTVSAEESVLYEKLEKSADRLARGDYDAFRAQPPNPRAAQSPSIPRV